MKICISDVSSYKLMAEAQTWDVDADIKRKTLAHGSGQSPLQSATTSASLPPSAELRFTISQEKEGAFHTQLRPDTSYPAPLCPFLTLRVVVIKAPPASRR